jgi:hypothetical protein
MGEKTIKLLEDMAAEAERESKFRVIEGDQLLLIAKRDALREALKRIKGERPDHLWARRHPLLDSRFPL